MRITPETRSRLETADDPIAIVRPHGLDQLERVRAIVPMLERAAGAPLRVDLEHDATHFCSVHAFRTNASGTRVAIMSIIFSTFGGLVTIYGSTDFPRDRFASLVPILRDAGYVYVDCDELSGEYDGANPKFHGTWFDRFFSRL